MKKHLILPIPLIIIFLLVGGCYTVISRPGEENGYVDRSGDYENYSEYYGYTHYYYPGYWTLYPRWGHYYATPWWWDYYDYYEADIYYDDDSPRPPQGEKAVGPAGRWHDDTPVVRNPGIIGGPGGGTSSPGSSTGSVGGKSGTSGNQTETKTKETKEKSKDEKTKETKRGGRWRKK